MHYDAYDAPWYRSGGQVRDVGYDLYDGEYHTYALWWSPDKYVFYVDGKSVWTTDYAGVSKVPEFMRLTVERTAETISLSGASTCGKIQPTSRILMQRRITKTKRAHTRQYPAYAEYWAAWH